MRVKRNICPLQLIFTIYGPRNNDGKLFISTWEARITQQYFRRSFKLVKGKACWASYLNLRLSLIA